MKAICVMTPLDAVLCAAILLIGMLPASTLADSRPDRFVYGKPGDGIGSVCINPRDGAEMVWVPAGEFIMGTSDEGIADIVKNDPKASAESCEDEKPQRKVHLDGFWMYKNKVTIGQYRNFCKATEPG